MRRGANDISCGEAWMRDSVRQLIWSVYSVYMQLMSLPCLQDLETAAQTSHGVAQAALCRERILSRRLQKRSIEVLGSLQGSLQPAMHCHDCEIREIQLTDIDRQLTGQMSQCASPQEGRNLLEGALEDVHDIAREEGGEGTTHDIKKSRN